MILDVGIEEVGAERFLKVNELGWLLFPILLRLLDLCDAQLILEEVEEARHMVE